MDEGGPYYEPGLVQFGRLVRLHKGGAQGPTKQQRRSERESLKMQQKQLALAEKQFREARKAPVMPAFETPPPPTQTSSEVVQAEEQARRDAARRAARSKTIFAGETGGYGEGRKSLFA